jgi:hypothetical protein
MNKLQLKHSSGFFSCCSVACYDIIEHIKQHQSVPEVDFSKTLKLYRDFSDQNAYDMYFKFNESQELNIDKISKIKYNKLSLFNYKDEDLKNIKPIIQKWFNPSDLVLEYVELFIKKYEIDMDKTLAICFRGTDKFMDIKETRYEDFISRAPSIINNEGINRVLIQTDQTQFIDFFKNYYPNIRVFNIQEIPTTSSKKHLYKGVIEENKVSHAQMFLASMQILSRCKFLINHSGNVARWIIKYRGSTHNTMQYKSNQLL